MDRFQALTRVCLNNWHYINRKILHFHESINFFTGHSGSGKSTVLDAIQVVLYADTNGRNFFNKAAKEDSDRTLIEYLRGMKTIRDNGGAAYLRNQNFSSTIVLEFLDTGTKELQCLGAAFDVEAASNDVSRLFFRHRGGLLDNGYEMDGRVLTTSQLRDYLKSRFPKEDIYYGRTNEAFRAKLYDEYLGGLNERKFVSLFKRAIPFRMNMELSQFVKEYICTEQNIRIEDMQESVTQYVRLKRRLEEIKDEIGMLEEVEEAYGRYNDICGERKQLFYNGRCLELLYLEDEIKELSQKQKAYNEDRERLKSLEGTLDKELASLNKERDQVLIAMENSGFAHLDKELASLEDKLAREKRSREIWDNIGAGLKDFCESMIMKEDTKEKVRFFMEYKISEEELKELKEAVRLHREETEESLREAMESEKHISLEIKRLQEELESLEYGKKVYPAYTAKARDYLKKRLFEEEGKEIAVDILADVIEVERDEWRNAIEGYLGNHKLSLLVPPPYAKRAMEIYGELSVERFYKASIVDTEKIMEAVREPMENSLSDEVDAPLPYVRAYTDYLLGGVIKCRSPEEMRKFQSGVTPDCMIYKGYKIQHMNPANYKEQAYIGQKSMEGKRTLLKSLIGKMEEERLPFKNRIKELKTLLSGERLELNVKRYMEYKEDIEKLPKTQEDIGILEEKIKALKEKTEGDWKEKLSALETLIQSKRKEKEETIKGITRLQANIAKTEEAFFTRNEEWKGKSEGFVREQGREAAYARYMEQAGNDSCCQLMTKCYQAAGRLEARENKAYEELTQKREEYNRDYSFRGFSAASRDNKKYHELLMKLKSDKLAEFMEKANIQARTAVRHFKTDFIYKIRDAIREAIQQKDELNRILAKLDFGKDRYHFVITKSRGEEGKFYDMFMDENLEINPAALSESLENQMDLFTLEHENRYNDYMNELLELFMPPENGSLRELEEARANLEKYADYRTYLSFDMEQRVEGMPVMHVSRMLSKNSGGEGQNPLYVALLASFAQIYRINPGTNSIRRPTPRLVVLDEAFSKMDGEKVGSCIGLIRKLGVQAIISATNDKIQNYVENVDKTFVFANPNKSSISIQEFERKDFHELEVV